MAAVTFDVNNALTNDWVAHLLAYDILSVWFIL